MSSGPILAPDAAIVLGIASTAMPFARTPEDEVERWLRLLRLHGQVGTALQSLGVSESPLPEVRHSLAPDEAASPAGGERDAVARVTEQAVLVASKRGGRALSTADVLVAVMGVYGEEFDRALHAHGTERAEVLERLGLSPAAADE